MRLFTIPKPIRKVSKHRKARSGKPGKMGIVRLYDYALAELRIQCFARDRGLCQECGQFTIFDAPHEWDNSFHMAHIQAKRRGGDVLSNVRVLCGGCHRKEHAGGKPCPKKVP